MVVPSHDPGGVAWSAPSPPRDVAYRPPLLPSTSQLSITLLESLGSPVLVLSGELDASTVPDLEAAISSASQSHPRMLTLDLSGLTFIDSSGLWLITRARRCLEMRSMRLSLIPGPHLVHSVFEDTGMADLLPFQPVREPREG
jgi:anti-anti-sigma factor